MRNFSDWAPKTGGTWPPTRRDAVRYLTARDGWEVLRWTLYDRVTYSGFGVIAPLMWFRVGSGMSRSRTSMIDPGKIPDDQEFVAHSIEFAILGRTDELPAAYGAAPDPTQLAVAGYYNALRAGVVQMTLDDDVVFTGAPFMAFPCTCQYVISAALADASTAAPAQRGLIARARFSGDPFKFAPPLKMRSGQTFTVTLSQPEGAQTLLGASAVVTSCYINGFLYRKVQ